MTTPKPLWDEERIFSRISELTANRSSSLAPTIAAGLVLRELRDDYEADRATQAARIASLEAQVARLQGEAGAWETLDDIYDVDRKPNLITNAQFRGLMVQGWRLQWRREAGG